MMPKPRMLVQKATRSAVTGLGLLIFVFLLVISIVFVIAAAVTGNTLRAVGDYNEANDSWQS
jgi:ABC-type uncharacterized transport system permease subunit